MPICDRDCKTGLECDGSCRAGAAEKRAKLLETIMTGAPVKWDHRAPPNDLRSKFDEHRATELWRRESTINTHPLGPVLRAAIEQAAFGKGERHGGAKTPFLEQQWVMLAQCHGVGFLTGQAAKKLNEAAAGKRGEEWRRELLGAIVYLGMALLHQERSTVRGLNEGVAQLQQPEQQKS